VVHFRPNEPYHALSYEYKVLRKGVRASYERKLTKTSTAQVLIRRLATGLGPPGDRRATVGSWCRRRLAARGRPPGDDEELRNPWNSVRLAV